MSDSTNMGPQASSTPSPATLGTKDKPYIGGQAVIEGVMMRSPNGLSVAVRRPDGSLAIHEEPYKSRFNKKIWKLMGFRGVATLCCASTAPRCR